jgi:heme exporter protein C|tara:strand:- start:1509 stop:2270 length:762 start_codon:yes stop_codon:yes gene_type:complete
MNKMWMTLKNWFIEMGSPPLFFRWATLFLPWLGVMAILSSVAGLLWGLGIAPTDYKQGDVYRIIFIHVPSAILGQSIYLLMAVFGFISLVWRAKIAGMLLISAAPIGAGFTLIALVTGSIWGKPTWGTWWVWDARLTSTLILFFLYVAIISLHSSLDNKTKADRAVSILSVLGISIVPIIKKSVDWWQTLHQPSTFTLTSSPSMTSDMYYPLLLCVFGFYCIFAFMLTNALRVEIISRERNKRWVKNLPLKSN